MLFLVRGGCPFHADTAADSVLPLVECRTLLWCKRYESNVLTRLQCPWLRPGFHRYSESYSDHLSAIERQDSDSFPLIAHMSWWMRIADGMFPVSGVVDSNHKEDIFFTTDVSVDCNATIWQERIRIETGKLIRPGLEV